MNKLYILKGYNNSLFRKPDVVKDSIYLFDNIKSIKDIESNYDKINNNRDGVFEILKKVSSGRDIYCYYEDIILIAEQDLLGLLNLEKIIVENNFFIDSYLIEFNESDRNYIFEEIEVEKDTKIQKFYSDIDFQEGVLYGKYNLIDKIEDLNKIKEIEKIEIGIFEEVETLKKDCISIKNNSSKEYINKVLYNIFNGKIREVFLTDKTMNYIVKEFLQRAVKENIKIYQVKNRTEKTEIPKNSLEKYEKILKRKDKNFSFKKFKIYKNPYESKEMIDICQSGIIHEIIENIKYSQSESEQIKMRDMFVTAPTGTGKSVMFQIPAIYAAEELGLMTVVISPLIGLMSDQIDQIESMTDKAVTINSDYTPSEKEKALEKIRREEKSILYLSPESLINNGNIENLIGQDRKIGLLVIDEAHTMVTWGKSFRPDYLYLGDFIYGMRNNTGNNFPIVTFTATASINENDNTHDEIISYLRMNSNDYIGSVRRNDIKFKHNLEMVGIDYIESKAEKVVERIRKFIKNNEKTLVYFPYKRHIEDIRVKFTQDDLKNIAIYTGNSNKKEKEETLKDIKSGKKKIVLATKAFGMGIDIKDISHVYHYAPTGTISDYVQEIGRAARIQEMEGNACIDCYKNDDSYTKSLNGMNRINNYEILGVLKKVYDIYKKVNSRRFLINPENFSYIFSELSNEELINRLKRIFLIIKKDFEMNPKLNYIPINFTPRAVFTKGYFLIEDHDIEKVEKIGYKKYFEIYNKNKKETLEYKQFGKNSADCSYIGELYEINFKRIWEENFNDISFNEFKYKLYKNELDFVKDTNILPQALLKIETCNKKSFEDIICKFSEKIKIIIDILKDLRSNNSYFSKKEFSKYLSKRLGNEIDEYKSELISNNIIEILKETNNIHYQRKCIEFNMKNKKYKIESSLFEKRLKDILKKLESFIAESKNQNSIVRLIGKKSSKIDLGKRISSSYKIKIAMLLEAFGYSTFSISSGFSPEISVKINNPTAIKNIIDNKFYSSKTLKDMKLADENNLKLMKIFIESKITDKEKWDFIEDYFLGNTDKYL